MYYDSLAEDDIYSQPNSLTKCMTHDYRNLQPFSIDNQIRVALPSSPAAFEEDEEVVNKALTNKILDHSKVSEYPYMGMTRNHEIVKHQPIFNSTNSILS